MINKSFLQIDRRIENIEKDLLFFKKLFSSFLSSKKISPQNDEQIWQKIKKDYEKIQEKVFKERYPSLYAKIRK